MAGPAVPSSINKLLMHQQIMQPTRDINSKEEEEDEILIWNLLNSFFYVIKTEQMECDEFSNENPERRRENMRETH